VEWLARRLARADQDKHPIAQDVAGWFATTKVQEGLLFREGVFLAGVLVPFPCLEDLRVPATVE
jgi:hypothetical protein